MRYKRKSSRAGRGALWGESYNVLKRRWTNTVALLARAQHVTRFAASAGRVAVGFEWHEPDRKRDIDGVSAGGRKLILDGLVAAGVIESDGPRCLAGFAAESFLYPGDDGYAGPKVLVAIYGGGGIGKLSIPHRLPDLNQLLAARELGVRRDIARRRSGRP